MLTDSLLGSFRGFSRNPLGIIALFIVLVYGIAGLVATSSNITGTNQTILLLLLSFFPFAVLYSFHKLVSEHFFKLFSPEDIGQKEFAVMVKAYLPDVEAEKLNLLADQQGIEPKERPEIDIIDNVINKQSPVDRTAILISAIWQSRETTTKRNLFKRLMNSNDDLDRILSAEENRSAIFDVINNLESFAAEIYNNNLDAREVRRRSRVTLSIYWPFAKRVIDKIRKETNNKNAYLNLEKMALDWSAVRSRS